MSRSGVEGGKSRSERLEAALRDNLHRRKTQARARAALSRGEGPPPEAAEPHPLAERTEADPGPEGT